jgi:hypothetical protein
MATPNDSIAACKNDRNSRPANTTTSKDGRWRTFYKVPGLMQFIPAGTFYARTKVEGKSVRTSLETEELRQKFCYPRRGVEGGEKIRWEWIKA